jgi:dienelactone hydrolase
MLRPTLVLTLLVLPQSRADGPVPLPDGAWAGQCRIGGKDVFLRLRLQGDGRRLKGAALSRELAVRGAAISGARDENSRLNLSFPSPGGEVRLSCDLSPDDRLAGTAEFAGAKGPCLLRRRRPLDAASFDRFRGDYRLDADRVIFVGRYESANYLFLADGDVRNELVPVGPDEFLADDLRTVRFETGPGDEVVAAAVAEPGREPRRAPRVRLYDEEAVTYSGGDVRLAATLTLPAGGGPHPAVVLVHGSGPGPRESYAVEADRFAREGIAVLAFDKRGSGSSGGDWRQADFDVLAGDVLAGVRFLRQDKRIRPDKVGLFGVSQAGWIIPLAASQSSEVAFIVPVSGGAVMPAEQELWRQRQNLEFLGVPERFIELARRAAAMEYDWQRRYQTGVMPLPSPFADDNLNMFHDAPAVLRRVRQPVLAVFGGLDTLTPTRESAAIWADALRRRGDDDYSVRLFPRGSHGLFEGGKTGSPLEVFRELRWTPGYIDTVVRWVHHHAGGPAFPEARRVDVDADDIPAESRGVQRVGWYGSGAAQPWQMLVALAAFASAALAAPVAWLYRRLRRVAAGPPGSRRLQWLFALTGALNVGILAALTAVLYCLVQAQPDPVIERLRLAWDALAGAAWLSLALTALVTAGCVTAWRKGWWPPVVRVYYTLVAFIALCWVPFLFYWDVARPAW